MALQTRDFCVSGKSSGGGITYTYTLRVTENSTNILANTSNVTVQAILKSSYSSTSFSSWGTGVSCSLNGNQIFSDYVQRRVEGTGEHIFYTWTGEITHNPNGSMDMTVSGELWQNASASYTPPRLTISNQVMALTVIPRASSFRATDADIGSSSVISIQTNDASFTHSLHYQFGNLSGYINAAGGHSDTEEKLTGTSAWFDLPESFYTQIPNAPYGTVTLTCRTYSGDTLLGDSQTGSFYANANRARCSPMVSGSVVDVNPATLALTGNENVLIRGRSTARCTILTEAKNGASIAQKKIAGTAVEADVLDVANAETASFDFWVCDSRGYDGSIPVNKEQIPYVLLTNNASAARTDPTSGNVTLILKGRCYKGSFGAADNTLTVTYAIEDGPVNAEVEWKDDGEYEAQLLLSGLDYQKAYNITVTAQDALDAVTKTIRVNKGIPVFDWREDAFNFNVPVYFKAGYYAD